MKKTEVDFDKIQISLCFPQSKPHRVHIRATRTSVNDSETDSNSGVKIQRSSNLVIDLLQRESHELPVLDYRSSKLQVAVQCRGLKCSELTGRNNDRERVKSLIDKSRAFLK